MSDYSWLLIMAFAPMLAVVIILSYIYCSTIRDISQDVFSTSDRETERHDYLRLISQVLEKTNVTQVQQLDLSGLHARERAEAYSKLVDGRKPVAPPSMETSTDLMNTEA